MKRKTFYFNGCVRKGAFVKILLFISINVLLSSYSSAAPLVESPTLDPIVIRAGIPTEVTLTSRITDPSLIGTSVNLQQLDGNTKPIGVLGILLDDGINGDAIAGDKIYTIKLTINQPIAGDIYLRVSAGFRGLMKRIFSSVVSLHVVQADAVATIGPEGGIIETEAGYSIEIPPGAISEPYIFSLNQIPAESLPNSLPNGLTIIGAVEILPHGVVFDKPITIKIKSNDPLIPEGTKIPIVSYSPTTGEYSFEGWFGKVDYQGLIVCQGVGHLSLFAGMYDKVAGLFEEQTRRKQQIINVLSSFLSRKNNLCGFQEGRFSLGDLNNKLSTFINRGDLSIWFIPSLLSDAVAKYLPLENAIILKDEPNNLLRNQTEDSVSTDIYHELMHYIFDVKEEDFERINYELTSSREENLTYFMEQTVSQSVMLHIADDQWSQSVCNDQEYLRRLNVLEQDARTTLDYMEGSGRLSCSNPCKYPFESLVTDCCDPDNYPNTERISGEILSLLNEILGFYVEPWTVYEFYESDACSTCWQEPPPNQPPTAGYVVKTGAEADSTRTPSQRKLAIESNGTLHTVYHRKDSAGILQIYHAQSTDGGKSWTEEPVTYATRDQIFPSLAIDSHGNLHLVWQDGKSLQGIIPNTYYNSKTTSWQGAEFVASYAAIPAIAIDSNDDVHVVYGAYIYPPGYWGGGNGIRWRKRTAAGWQPEKSISDEKHWVEVPAVAIDANNHIHVVWQHAPGSYYDIHYRQISPSGQLGPESQVNVETSNEIGSQMSLAIDANNHFHVVWQHGSGGYYTIKHREYTGSWQTTHNLEGPTTYAQRYPSITIDSKDHIHVVWSGQSAGSPTYHQIRYKEYTGLWQQARNLTSSTSNNQTNPNSMWAFYPMINGLKINQMQDGYAFIWMDGTTIKYLNGWEVP